MMYSLRVFLTSVLLCAALGLTACTPEPEAPPAGRVYNHSIFSFGTFIDVSIYTGDKALADRAFEQLEQDFLYMHTTWHPWQHSALQRNNSLIATLEWFSDAPSVRPLIVMARDLSTASEDLFNPAIGKLVRLWKFHRSEEMEPTPPDPDDIEYLVEAHPTMRDLEIDGVRMRSRNPEVLLDLGGFAKGYGINLGIQSLQALGIRNAIINAGGDLRAIGRPGNRPWRIAIRHPRQANTVLAHLEVEGDMSVFTSGDYERYYEHEGKRYHHIIDPRTGYPATGSQSVTVLHPDAARADAAATALFVAGPKDWHRIARSMGIHHVLLVDDRGLLHMNPGMARLLHFPEPIPPDQLRISAPLTPGE